nr:MAG TPA: hypothetical protein [Caudoviricetes sp.]
MAKYKLLKDLPTFKAGDLFYISQCGDLMHDGGNVGIMAYARHTLDMFPDILTEWFEEVQESTDSIHWKPKNGDEYFYVSDYGCVYSDIWRGKPIDDERLALGIIHPTEEGCKKAKKRQLAEVRLRRTSTFEPDLKSGMYAYTVGYNFKHKRLYVTKLLDVIVGNPIIYKSLEEAEKSIEENREDWLIYFGIEEEE